MSIIETHIESYDFNRGRTLTLLDQIEKGASELQQDTSQILGWRCSQGRAHIAWQLTHIAVTEELFATERLAPEKSGKWTSLWPRFRNGSVPDDDIPTIDLIRQVLAESRRALLTTLREYSDEQLDEIPPAFSQRGWTLRTVLSVIGWHEAHHQGQAHLTLNLYRCQRAKVK